MSTAEERATQISQQLDALQLQWTQATASWVRDAWQQELDRLLDESPGRFKALADANRLQELKAKFQDLMARADELTTQTLAPDRLWPHRRFRLQWEPGAKWTAPDNRILLMTGSRLSGPIEDVLRSLLGYLGELVLDYDLDDNQNGRWRRSTSQSGPSRQYGFGLNLSEDQRTIARDYAAAGRLLTDALVEIEEAKHSDDASNAKRLWDEA